LAEGIEPDGATPNNHGCGCKHHRPPRRRSTPDGDDGAHRVTPLSLPRRDHWPPSARAVS